MRPTVRFDAVDPPGPSVTAYLGDGPAEAMGNGGWAHVARPRRKAATEWQGQDSYVLSVPIMFDGFATGTSVEPEVETLRRIMRVPVGPRKEPAAVSVSSEFVPLGALRWVIETIKYGETIRDDTGSLIRLSATVNLMEYLAAEVFTVAKVTAAQAVAEVVAPVSETKTHTVGRGETLWGIAQRLLGDGRRWHEIAALNDVRDPRTLRIGQELRLP